MSARGYGLAFLLFGLGWIGWLMGAWFLSDDISRTYLPLAVGQTAPFALGFFGLGLWLITKRTPNSRPPEEGVTPPLDLPATRWRELPPNGK